MTPRALVFTLFGDYLRYCGEGEVPLSGLTRMLEHFGVDPGTTRVVMTRLRKEGWFESRRNGREVRYLLSDKGWRLLDEGRERIFRRGDGRWDRRWSMVIVKFSEHQRVARDEARKKLAWLGFGQLSASTWMSPHPRLDDVERALAELPLVSLDLLSCSTRSLAEDRSIAARCWDLGDVQADYATFVEEFASTPELHGVEAFMRHVELTNAYRQFPFRDPDLPEELLPDGWTGRAAHRVFTRVYASLERDADRVVEELAGLPVLRD
ncbi:phenylacetic acid-responsive transcriptional repressor [Leucobacter sp. CSA1]|uniref:Phenylacetic acid-responsive transcriptional repressor n=1 Tax=Leucobacter chromiisoli TaxID=2796471 RepID=A0A934Q8Q2_9MICO|nr:PaaX family transcriptional regulator C-terminal domain-containing protein [Leucobacter chromiisoli]MBK0420300.1 phenylacetic acid-responsive transcriptional repressor [Leucobacter chromiisoli]